MAGMRRMTGCGWWRVFAISAALSSCLAGQFVPPAEGPVAFRRDRLPLDVETLSELSENVATLAGAMPQDTAAQRRGAAQMMALALALDPSNARARRLVESWSAGSPRPESADRLAQPRARIRQAIRWLETPAAGTDGRALAACLSDVMAVADPDHPRSVKAREAGEAGAWARWVPEISAYEKQESESADPAPDPAPPSADEVKPQVLLTEAEVLTPLWTRKTSPDGTAGPWSMAPLPLKLKAKPLPEKNKPLFVTIGADQGPASLPQLGRLVTDLLKARHPELPAGVRLHVTCPPLEQSVGAKLRTSVSAPALVLAESALRGSAPAGAVVALVDSDGGLGLPRGLWAQLRSIEEAAPGRLVTPAAASTYLSCFLVLENPGFFMENQVLLAAGTDELLALSSSEPDAAIAGVLDRFREIQEKQGGQDLRLYIGNRFIKQRLADIVRDAPWHFSARMLLTQALGNRPVMLPRPVLAAEIRRELRPLEEFANLKFHELNLETAARAGVAQDATRERIAALDRYVARADREMAARADGMLDALRDLERVSRARGTEAFNLTAKLQTAGAAFQKSFREYAAYLQEEAGDTPEQD